MTSASGKYSNLAKRVLVAVLAVPLMLLGIFWSPWAYFALFLIICTVSVLEFYRLIAAEGHPPLIRWGLPLSVLAYTIPFAVKMGLLSDASYLLIFPGIALIFLSELYRKAHTKPFTNLAYTFLGLVYVALPFALLHTIAFYRGQYEPGIVAGILFLTWASDTGGYFAGLSFGRTKLFERISPRKTWEGFAGSAALGLAMAWVLSGFIEVLPLWKWIVLSILAFTAGTFGDLVESLFKRSLHTKDSGSILPGHGGFLDRFDAMLLSLPFIAAFLALF